MDWLEQELKEALARKEPSADFASRVMRRAERPERKLYRFPRWLAAAAAVIVLAGAGLEYRQYRGEQAKEQLLEAFRIASVKVNHIQTQVQEVGK
ncbi:MAG TPA: hypothetical protein VMB03_18800 [Bryobacteraceae bacterium]|nr:hypothetical protein [Bryobacteraceae bacterium]